MDPSKFFLRKIMMSSGRTIYYGRTVQPRLTLEKRNAALESPGKTMGGIFDSPVDEIAGKIRKKTLLREPSSKTSQKSSLVKTKPNI